MKRRNFILLSLYGGTAISFPFISCNPRSTIAGKAWIQPVLLSHICDAKTIKEIGNAYREKFPGVNTEKQLTNLLLTDNDSKLIPAGEQDAVINSMLEQKIKKNFETGKTVIVKGWILSETEAQQCALFSLTQN